MGTWGRGHEEEEEHCPWDLLVLAVIESVIKVGKTSKNTKPSLQPNTIMPTELRCELTHLLIFQTLPKMVAPLPWKVCSNA